jgi:hypothetical protein
MRLYRLFRRRLAWIAPKEPILGRQAEGVLHRAWLPVALLGWSKAVTGGIAWSLP